jgi:protein TonB
MNLLVDGKTPLAFRQGAPFSGGILFSIFVHSVFLLLLFVVAPISAPLSPTLSSYKVSLISHLSPQLADKPALMETVGEADTISQKPVEEKILEVPKELPRLKANPKPSDIVENVPPSAPPVPVVKKAIPVEPPPVVDPRPAEPVPANPGEATVSIRGIAPAGKIGAEEGIHPLLARFSYYTNKLGDKVSAQWIPPVVHLTEGQEAPIVVVQFVVKRDGLIDMKSVFVEKSSGSTHFDASGLRAIYNANPFPPFPRGITEDLRIHFEFRGKPDS